VTLFLVLLYTLVVPYLLMMLVVVAGMLRRPERPVAHKTPAVSVVIPAHNEEARLGETLASLAEQRYAGELEFVIVNDRSTDATPEIIDRFVRRDARFRRVDVRAPSKRLSPKVNAVAHGIEAARGEIILTSDADCQYPPTWVRAMASHFAPDVAMVVGYVESTRPGEKAPMLHKFESTDWLSLMLTSRSLLRFGWAFASSANNQAYRKRAFEAIGGFGASGRAPSGDEDLLTQRMARRQRGRIVFADAPETRVLTRPMPNLWALLNQRRRWVSRYRHMLHYHPLFLACILTLGAQSIVLSAAVVMSPFAPALLPHLLFLWGSKLAIEFWGMHLGTSQLGRRDLWGWPVVLWALAHPFFIATVTLWALLQSGEWRAGAERYRRRYLRRRWREWRRRLGQAASGLL
jgi:cellulose synthase/poly-beta-1,6-N-acetylglucosamine synthase-like glycosyltransferase